MVAALFRDRWPDLLISGVSLAGMSVPEFTVATLLVLLFSIRFAVFPAVVIAGPSATLGQAPRPTCGCRPRPSRS